MNSCVSVFFGRSRVALVTLCFLTSALTGCKPDVDYRSLASHVPFGKVCSSSGQTDVDRAQHLVDAEGVPFLRIDNVGKQRHPAWVALYALAYAGTEVYDERLIGLQDARKFRATIEWLEKNLHQNHRGLWVWEYHFDSTYNDISIKAPWSSAFAQATGIQALTVAYERTGESRYIELAKKAAQALFTPLAAGGFLFEADADIWFEEIPVPIENPGHILNGHMRVLLALADLYKVTNDPAIETWLRRGTKTLHRWLPKFDTGYWLRYDLNPRKKDLLFRFANPYGFPAHPLAIDKITLRDPVSKSEVSVDVGQESDAAGAARIAGTHWGQIEEVAGRSARRLIPAALDDKPDEMRAPHSYFYLPLPGEWKDNLRERWYELVIEYYDDARANITVQQRSIAPGQAFRDMRDGDLHLTGSGNWRKWIVPIRTSDLGYWVGNSYATKHLQYLSMISEGQGDLAAWAKIAAGYLNLVTHPALLDRVEPKKLFGLPHQTPILPIYSLDANGVVRLHVGDPSIKRKSNGELGHYTGRGTPVYSPYLVAEQLISGDRMPGANTFMSKAHRIRKDPALRWLLNPANYKSVGNGSIYFYPFDNVYNDVASRAPWSSAFGQAYVLKSFVRTLEDEKGNGESLRSAIEHTGLGFSVELSEGGVAHVDRSGYEWYEEVPNATHVLNAHLVSVPELAAASRVLSDRNLKDLSNRGILALKEKLHLFDTGYWLRYDQNPKKELLLQLDWIDGEASPLIDEVLIQNPQTGRYVSLDVGAPADAEGYARISGSEWGAEQMVDGRTVRQFANGYRIRSEPVPGGAVHNVFFVLQIPEWDFDDVFDVPPHRLIVRYKDVNKSRFDIKIQSIHEGNRLAFAPLRGGVWELQGDQQWKEAVFTIRPQDMGWYKGPDYQQYEVEQLQRIANMTNDWFFYQYAERHRDFIALQREGVSAVFEKPVAKVYSPVAMHILDAGKTYPGHGFDNSLDGDSNDDYTAGIESDTSYVTVEFDREVSLAAVDLHWESEQNRAEFVRVQEVYSDGSIGPTLAEGSPGRGKVARVRLKSSTPVKRLRIDFGSFAGQHRILLRQITPIEDDSADVSFSTVPQHKTPYLDERSSSNPLSIFRTPISQRIKILSDRFSVGANSDHEKIIRFMDHIAQFRVGIEGDGSPDTTVQYRVGACGTFTGTLLALAASQGLAGRYVNFMNYPSEMGHTVAEIFYNGKWHLYDPTYNAFYVKMDEDSFLPLSFEELKSLYSRSPERVRLIARTYRPGMSSFTGAKIFNHADPIGPIGPGRPQYYPLSIDLERLPILEAKDFGLAYQGAGYIGAAGVNQNHRWSISGLTPGQMYVFLLHPGDLGGDVTALDRSFDLILSMKNGRLLNGERSLIDFSRTPVLPVEIPFVAHEKSVVLSLSHPYRGPDFRYFSVLRYEIRRLDKD